MFPLFGRRPPAPTTDGPVGIMPSPLSIRLRHIDVDLAKLAAQPRTDNVRRSIDFLLDKRLALRPPRPATVPVVPGRGGEGGAS